MISIELMTANKYHTPREAPSGFTFEILCCSPLNKLDVTYLLLRTDAGPWLGPEPGPVPGLEVDGGPAPSDGLVVSCEYLASVKDFALAHRGPIYCCVECYYLNYDLQMPF